MGSGITAADTLVVALITQICAIGYDELSIRQNGGILTVKIPIIHIVLLS